MDAEQHHAAPIMEMSADIAEIAKALPKAQAAMGDVFKNANNPAFKSKYADLAAVIEAVLPALNKVGISLLQPVAFDGEHVNVGTMLLHESGQWVRCTLSLPLGKRDAHGIGSAVTYGKRYGLQSMSGVAPEDDDGNAASGPRQAADPKRVDPPTHTLADRAERFEKTMRATKTPAELEAAYKLGSGLMSELDTKDPERFETLKALHAELDAKMAPKLEAAE